MSVDTAQNKIFLQRKGLDCTGAGLHENQPIWFEQVCLFDVSLSSELTPYMFNTPVKLNDRAKFYTSARQEDRKNKTKHLRLSGLATRIAWSKTETELIAQAEKTKTNLSCHARQGGKTVHWMSDNDVANPVTD